MDLVNSETTNLCSYITFMVIYCLTTPMGVVIGVGVTEGPTVFDSTAVGILQVSKGMEGEGGQGKNN